MKEKIIVIYDGECGICNHTIQFILNNKPKSHIRFISFQSQIVTPYLKKYDIKDMSSIVIIEKGRSFKKSTAMLLLVKNLQTSWRHLYYFIVIPKTIRDIVYQLISRNRHRFIKTQHSCRFLSNEEKSFFLSD